MGIDLHRRRSMIVRMTAGGGALECLRIDNDRAAFVAPGGQGGAKPGNRPGGDWPGPLRLRSLHP